MEKHIALALLHTLSTSEKVHLASMCHDGEEVFRYMGLEGNLRTKLMKSKDFCLKWLEQPSNHITRLGDEGYPPLLKEIDNPPYLMAFHGSPSCCGSTITIVGSGMPSREVRAGIHLLVGECAESDIAVVSGLSCNLQRCVLESVVACKGRAVVVSGGESLCDSTDRGPLVEKIIDLGGAVVGEFPPIHPRRSWHIPLWTRIPAGWSPVTVVGASPLHSEAMMVADFALDQGRDVVVFGGGALGPVGTGGSSLVQDGAPLVHSLQDISGHSKIGCPQGDCRCASEEPCSYIPGL